MYDYGARFYEPSISLWTSVDPMAEAALDWTPYRYGFNNPVQYTDPDGMFEDKATAKAFQKENNICGSIHEQDGIFYIQGSDDHSGQQYSYGGTSSSYGADVPSGKRLSVGDTREVKAPDPGGVVFNTGIFGTSRTETYTGNDVWNDSDDFDYVKHQKIASSAIPIGRGIQIGKLAHLRLNYVTEVKGLSAIANKMRIAGKSSEEIARSLHGLRRNLGVKYKSLTPTKKLNEIYNRNLKRYGDKLGPTINYLRQQGKSWDDVINSASKPGGKGLSIF